MNRINLIILNSSDSAIHNTEIGNALAKLNIELNIVTKNNFLAQPNTLSKGINVFLFDSESLSSPPIRQLISNHLHIALQHINLCLVFDAGILVEDADFFSPFNDFLIWPCSAQEICARLLKFLQPKNTSYEQENKLLQEFSSLHLTGSSPVFIRTLSLIKRIANCHASVLIQGETGTGKENAARAIHYLSDRRDYPFIPINCAAIPDELLESELFGHEKGTFTDAKTKQVGLISLAQQGTLFLDEVDSLTPKAQAALLRFLQTQEYRPLGSKITLQADVRIVAATNANLKLLAEQKNFREDLYFCLNVLNIEMPALRHRLQDIPLIATALIDKFSQQYKMPAKKMHAQSITYLMQQSWPGNIRELENIILRHFLLSTDSTLMIENEHLLEIDTSQSDVAEDEIISTTSLKNSQLNFKDAKAQAINHFEEHYLKELMTMAEGNVSAAARMAGKERRALGKLLQKHQIQKTSLYKLAF